MSFHPKAAVVKSSVLFAMDVPAELVAFAEDLADVAGKVILQYRSGEVWWGGIGASQTVVI